MTDPTSYAAGIEDAARVCDRRREQCAKHADSPMLSEDQKEIWCELANENLDNARAIRALAAAPPPPVPVQGESGEVVKMLGETASFGGPVAKLNAIIEAGLEANNSLDKANARIRELEGEVARLTEQTLFNYNDATQLAGRLEAASTRAGRLTAAAQAARDALEKQLAAMAEGFVICPRCGEQDTTSDLDFVGPLRDALASLASVLDGGEE